MRRRSEYHKLGERRRIEIPRSMWALLPPTAKYKVLFMQYDKETMQLTIKLQLKP